MRRTSCALTVFFCVTVTVASAERLPLRVYTTTDGLADDRIKCIVPDSRGFIWFCAPGGLSRFDGQGFTTYAVPDEPVSNSINDFLETSRGVYWVATNGGGVYRFTPSTIAPPRRNGPVGATVSAATAASRFMPFRIGDERQTNRVNVLHEDSSGRLWAGTDGGVFVLDERIDPWTFRRASLDLPDSPDRALQVWAFADDRAGTLWIGTSSGLVRRSRDGRIVHTAVQKTQGSDNVRALLIDRESRLWIGHETGLFVKCFGEGESPSCGAKYAPRSGVAGGMIRALLQSADGDIWIGAWNRVTRFDGSRFRSLSREQGITKTIALAEDLQGNIWFGTAAGGAMRLARHGFTAYTEQDGLADTAIGSVFENHAGELYVISSNQRAHRFEGERFTAVRPNLTDDDVDPIGPGVALQDRAGYWWIPGGAGLYRFANATPMERLGRVRPEAIYTARDALAGDDVFRIFEDSRGDVWIGRRMPTTSVLTRWERSTQTFYRYSQADNLPAFNRTTAFAEDQSGNVWIGFWNGGLARYRNGRFTLLTAADGIPSGGIGALYVDRRGRLWIGSTAPGLSWIDSPDVDHPRVIPYGAAHRLSGATVGCIVEDQMGRLYLGMTSGRIDRLDPETGRVRHYTKADGLNGADLTTAFRDRSGSLWFGTYNGLLRLVPEHDRAPDVPAVLIASVRVAGETFVTSDLGRREIPALELEPAQNQVRIEFFGLGGPPDVLRYQYRLEGAETNWSTSTDRRDVNYAGLAPGTYRFVVRTVTADGALSPELASVRFTILPPIWQRWWFQTGAALTMIAFVLVVHRHRVAQLVALERVRMRIAADLHDDIGGSLSRISIQSEVACREAAADGEQPVRRLIEIAESARHLIEALSDVVWSVDPRKDDMASVLRRIRTHADDLLSQSGARWSYHAPPNLEWVKLDPEARRHLFLLLKEAVTNVARHAQARSVSLHVGRTSGELSFELCDDGRGFDLPALESGGPTEGRGLASMRARAVRLRARLIIDSTPGAGTRLSLRLPLRPSWQRMIMLLPTRLR